MVIAIQAGALYKPEADEASMEELKKCLKSKIEIRLVDVDLNDTQPAGLKPLRRGLKGSQAMNH